jgi:hypothetical protein
MNTDKNLDVHTMEGRLGRYVLISDLQRIMLKDSVLMQRDGHEVASKYAETFADNLVKLKSYR